MSQSRSSSALEAGANVAVGWLLAVGTQLVLFPVVGLQATLAQNLTVGSVFTGLSLVRGYVLRRVFDRMGGATMPRPFLTLSPPAQTAEVETLAALLNAAQIADYFGIGRTTFYAILEREPEGAERYKRGKARAIGSIAQTLISKARAGDTASMIFFLKTQGGWRETRAIEHVGPDGEPLPLPNGPTTIILTSAEFEDEQGDDASVPRIGSRPR